MASDALTFGRRNETLAVQYLRRKGYQILEQNYRTPYGEVDIVADHRNVTVFIEVKARRSSRYGSPKGAVTVQKQRKLSMAALSWLKRHGKPCDRARFDVVSIDHSSAQATIEIISNAFELAYE